MKMNDVNMEEDEESVVMLGQMNKNPSSKR
jgi:hypothetical protein